MIAQGVLIKTARPMYLRDDGVVFSKTEAIGWWPVNRVTEANLLKCWGRPCRIWLDGEGEIMAVKAR